MLEGFTLGLKPVSKACHVESVLQCGDPPGHNYTALGTLWQVEVSMLWHGASYSVYELPIQVVATVTNLQHYGNG
jgi:hypothetical protein